MAETKITRRTYLNELIALVETTEHEKKEDYLTFLHHEVDLLDNRNERAQKRTKAKQENDELIPAILDVLSETEIKTAEGIAAELVEQGYDATRSKVSARLIRLAKAGEVEKTNVAVDKRTLVGYTLSTGSNE